ncbi:MAG: hypothetical protein ABUL69_04725 [Peristeroidobacter soli]
MIRLCRFPVLLVATLVLGACQPKTETPESAAEESTDSVDVADAAPKLALLDACNIKMTQPIAYEWETKWNPAHIQTAGENPSGVRSTHWGDANEQKVAHDIGGVIPFDVVCGSPDDVKPEVKFDITAFDSAMTDVPLAPGTYKIAPKASPAKNKPGEFIVGVFILDDSMFAATSGTLTLERFDANGAKGSFVIDGHEILMGDRPLHVEGTFDMPCRKGLLQGACQSDKAEQPN